METRRSPKSTSPFCLNIPPVRFHDLYRIPDTEFILLLQDRTAAAVNTAYNS